MGKVGITACSNALPPESREENLELIRFLQKTGAAVQVSRCIYAENGPFSGTGKERAEELQKLFADPQTEEIYDISGGDLANEILDYLDFPAIGKSRAVFWGYSDLTTVLNAIYAKTGKSSVLYSVRNLLHEDCRELQRLRFLDRKELFSPECRMLQGDALQGILVGGNLRCFLKLAGTGYFPDLQDKILLLEARSGGIPQMVTGLAQLKALGAFEKVRGILLGTFCQLEAEGQSFYPLLRRFAGPDLPVAQTREIGHCHDSRAVRIGAEIRIYG